MPPQAEQSLGICVKAHVKTSQRWILTLLLQLVCI